MQDRYSILIDGGFARRKLGSAKNPATATEFKDLVKKIGEHALFFASKLHRVYYYDAVPYTREENKPLCGGKVDFSTTSMVQRSNKLFSELAQLPYIALRMGELAFMGWEVKPKLLHKNSNTKSLAITHADLNPSIQQKGVDMRIGMDIAALSLKKIVQSILLVTGDSDLVPAMKFARREGLQVFLATLGQNVLPSMIEHSDMRIDFDQNPLKGGLCRG